MFDDEQNKIEKFRNKIWLSSPTMHGEELEYMTRAYETNWMSTVGKNINDLEESFRNIIGVNASVAVASGTSAIHLAVKLAGIKPGEKVFCSDVTFAASVNPIIYEKGEPIFIDSEYDTWNMDPNALKKAFELYPDTKYVILVHLYGTPAKVDEIKKICDDNGAILIEDSAESLGSTYKGKHTGSFGNYGIISFNGNKIITGSSGGMLLSDDEESIKRAKKWSTQSRDKAPWYHHTEIGYNYRMSNVVAGVALAQVKYLQDHIKEKNRIYESYKEGLRNLPVKVNPYDVENSEPNFWLSCMLIDNNAMSECKMMDCSGHYELESGKTSPLEILDTLFKFNTEGRPIWKPMHMQPIFNSSELVTKDGILNKEEKDTSVGFDIFSRGMCLPSDIKMKPEEQEIIIKIINKCFE
ncbi:aminotransferase class I/II-fold pyridoxal phosphate-dependent enzyme [Finegoldia magna]|uniref:aminotransferase class I/II-fold pyridoxal phosphate-dependent enzyme n=1 Tax=Finegoldia magna TaxID=1260 RepID=UPI002903857C|nr:aminotransferase class I/II-fold pyridoxal phosphate-dependent enzyme [Finegoldia magna]MDU2218970.1 aminotransferase class V-fold PLP-dependent enzyme [Finegoldia magna]